MRYTSQQMVDTTRSIRTRSRPARGRASRLRPFAGLSLPKLRRMASVATFQPPCATKPATRRARGGRAIGPTRIAHHRERAEREDGQFARLDHAHRASRPCASSPSRVADISPRISSGPAPRQRQQHADELRRVGDLLATAAGCPSSWRPAAASTVGCSVRSSSAMGQPYWKAIASRDARSRATGIAAPNHRRDDADASRPSPADRRGCEWGTPAPSGSASARRATPARGPAPRRAGRSTTGAASCAPVYEHDPEHLGHRHADGPDSTCPESRSGMAS